MSIICRHMVGAGPHNTSFGREPISGRETVFARIRNNRPRPESEHDCPFCPGNETLLAEISWQLDGKDGWRTRAVANRYPIVAPPAGRHEVIVESPRHGLSTAEMSPGDWQDILTTWNERHRALRADWRFVALYRNAGRHAGATIDHPHSHLVALPHIPTVVRSARRRLQSAFHRTGRCLLCEHLERVGADGRIIAESDRYAAIVPEVPEVSCEIWIVPRTHASLFALDDQQIGDLAAASHDVVRRMYAVLGSFDHNMMLECAGSTESPWLHWYLRLRPRLEYGGGFELATGMSVNASHPEEDAARLRNVGVPG